MLISFGNYYIEFEKIKNSYHFNQLNNMVFNNYNISANECKDLISYNPGDLSLYFVKNIKQYSVAKTELSFNDLISIYTYTLLNPNVCF